MKTMTINLPDDLYERLHVRIAENGAIADEFMECAITNYLALGDYARTAMPELNPDGTKKALIEPLGSSGYTDTGRIARKIIREGIQRAGRR